MCDCVIYVCSSMQKTHLSLNIQWICKGILQYFVLFCRFECSEWEKVCVFMCPMLKEAKIKDLKKTFNYVDKIISQHQQIDLVQTTWTLQAKNDKIWNNFDFNLIFSWFVNCDDNKMWLSSSFLVCFTSIYIYAVPMNLFYRESFRFYLNFVIIIHCIDTQQNFQKSANQVEMNFLLK